MEFPRDGDKPSYPYRKLTGPHIRRLRLISGRKGTELLASLEFVELPSDQPKTSIPVPEYEALSYFWGEESRPVEDYFIKIIEGNNSFDIRLRPNLDAAFRMLRYENEDRLLWVDAICINQSSKEEMNAQIPRMLEIYNKARRVCVWLGPESDEENSADAMEFVETMLNLDAFDRLLKDGYEVERLSYFATLLMRPWFNRRWIVQELAVARDAQVYCGNAQVSWTKFAGAVSLFSSKHVDLKKVFRSSPAFHHSFDYLGDVKESGAYQLVHAASNFFRKSDEGDILDRLQSLEDIVSTLATFDASDPRDVIYAVVSLSNDAKARTRGKGEYDFTNEDFDLGFSNLSATTSPVSEGRASTSRRPSNAEDAAANMSDSGFLKPEGWRLRRDVEKAVRGFLKPFRVDTIQVKYESSVFEVYKDFLELVIRRSGSLDILCRPWAAADDDLPSWIPGKSHATHSLRNKRAYSRVRADFLVGSPRDGGKQYSANKDAIAIWDYRPHDGVDKSLVKALVVKGFVLDTLQHKLWPAMSGTIPSNWFKAFDDIPSKKKSNDAFWRMLVADRGLEGQKPPPTYYKLACDYLHTRRNHMGGLDTREVLEEDCPPIVKEFLVRLRSVIFLRRMIVTKDRTLIGLVPPETKKRDKICIIDGCSVPVVLREVPVPRPGKAQQATGTSTVVNTSKIADNNKIVAVGPGTVSSLPRVGGGHAGVIVEEANTPSKSTMPSGSVPNGELLGLSQPTKRTRRPSIVVVSPRSNLAESPTREVVQPSQAGSEEASASDRSRPASPTLAQNHSKTAEVNRETPTPAPAPAPNSNPAPQPEEQENMRSAFSASRKTSWELPRHYYEFIGECYIHGMMEGEAMKLHSSSYKKQDFWLI